MAKRKTNRRITPSLNESKVRELISEEVAAKVPKVETGVTVAVPSVTKEKMQAICELCHAVSSLAKSLESVNVTANISDCTFHNNQTGVRLFTE